MQLELGEVVDGVRSVALVGRLDTPGVDQIETRFTAALSQSGTHAIVDLSRVEFVGSMGIRMFISVASAMARHKHKLVLCGAQPLVADLFETVALGDIVPVVPDAAAAHAAARG